MAQWLFIDELLEWLLETSNFEFDWDSGNSTKIAMKHRVLTDEVESVFRSKLALPLGLQVYPRFDENRFGLVGPALSGRLLQVAFTFRKGKVRVISARPAARKERKRYEEILRQIKEGI